MLSSISKHLHGIFSTVTVIWITAFWAIPIYILALTKFLVPSPVWQRITARISSWLVERWIGCILFAIRLTMKTVWDIRGVEGLHRNHWYFINSNHQFWTDIPAILMTFHNRVPSLKIFLKQELFWVPIVGIACWVMDFPFMKRYSQSYIKKHPDKRGKDLMITRKACERYRNQPVSILNFIEGTRLRSEKQKKQQSPYRHLLRPKAGGFAYAIHAMDNRINTLLDATIVYPDGWGGFWYFLCGRVSKIIVRVKKCQIPQEFLNGDYLNDHNFRTNFQNWINERWEKKDELIEKIMSVQNHSEGDKQSTEK